MPWNLKTVKGIELIEISKIELLAWLAGLNQSQLAAAMGIKEGRLSEYLSGKKPIGPTAVKQFARALGTTPEKLMKVKNLSPEQLKAELREKVLGEEALVDDSPAPVHPITTPTLRLIEPDYTACEAADLDIIRSIEQAEGRIRLPVWPELIAAGAFVRNDPTQDQEFVWVPADVEKIYGAKARALRIRGESMNRLFGPDSTIFGRLISDPAKAQGKIAIIRQGDEMTVKWLRGKYAEPDSDDPQYKRIKLTADATAIAYVFGVHKPSSTKP